MNYKNLIDSTHYTEVELKKLLELAYKKLKSDTYYDNSNLFLRSEIANNEQQIDSIIEELCYIILNKDTEDKIEVEFYCLPKKLSSTQAHDSNVVCNDLSTSNYTIDKITYFIKLDLKYHILGTLWVLLAGEILLKENSSYIYGRRLHKNFKNNDTRLFKPYHEEYSKWRDKAIKHSEHLLNNNDRCLMISLDIKDYYYSVDIDFEKLRENLQISSNDTFGWEILGISKKSLLIKLTKQIEDITKTYTDKILDLDENYKKKILPIGYMPSNILSNWYLKEFDKSICEEVRPIYYGRYIDDMLIVIPYTHNKKGVNQIDIINKYFCKSNIFTPILAIKNNDSTEYIFFNENDIYSITSDYKLNNIDTEKKLRTCVKNILRLIEPKDIEFKDSISKIVKGKDFKLDDSKIYNKACTIDIKTLSKEKLIALIKLIAIESNIKSDNIERLYALKDKLINNKNVILAIQNTKIKLYDFKPDGSRAIIEKFKNEIKKNASIFRFLPEKDLVVNSFDEEVLEIRYSEGINKIRSIEDFKINKYNLSKFLAQVIYSEKLDSDLYSKDLDEKILSLFSGMNIIEFYILWEKAMICYIMNDNKEYLNKFIKNIDDEITNIRHKEFNLKFNMYKHKNENIIHDILFESLKVHLHYTISMVWGLNDDIFIDKDYPQVKYSSNKDIEDFKNNLRYSNMLRHSYILEPLINYTNIVTHKCMQKILGLDGLNLIKNQFEKDSINFGFKCTKINSNYTYKVIELDDCKLSVCDKDKDICEEKKCIYKISANSKKYTPRYVHLHEIILYQINRNISEGKIISGTNYIREAIKLYKEINNINDEMDLNLFANSFNDNKESDEKNKESNKEIFSDYVNNGKIKRHSVKSNLFDQNEININLLKMNSDKDMSKLKIAIAHIDVLDINYKSSIMKTPILDGNRLQKLYHILNQSVKQGANMILFPELSIPYSWLSVIANFARKHQLAIICGLEHIVYENNIACNYLATILPGKYNDYTYSVVKLRLKNHYAPSEIEMLRGYNINMPIMKYKYNKINKINPAEFVKEYDLFRWNGIDFSCYNCFELSSLNDRGLFMSYVDLLIGSVHNKDVNHYSNIIESLSRDVHCYFAQVNNSKLGDNRIVAPKKTVQKNILQITGGQNDTLLIGEIDILKLREFQLQDYNLQLNDKSYKPTPPEFNKNILKLRMNRPL
ncbi:hypothetical protein CHL78_016160 [Romboutsia weinsteinii]|uniref:Reverse transcriptase domain-containing protein n=1 Tax=Romboutsia weinsteinii TaxID=2020949 RepID=A0A371IZB7_9FIRM|nr:hypothetical protein [Romboutsia weinsteinii]RDY25829.1 hypothetical protein CHL78_016160 [Romboutsia weinsteinii]